MRPSALTVLAFILAGCAWRGTAGALFEEPSRGSDLPFRSDGLYHAQPRGPCDRDDVPYEPPQGEPRAVMAFGTDGTFTFAHSEAALRGESALGAYRGNYRVSGDTVRTRVVTPGGDSAYRRIVTGFALVRTGPESFYYDAVRAETFIVRYGVYENRLVACYRQPFAFRRSGSGA